MGITLVANCHVTLAKRKKRYAVATLDHMVAADFQTTIKKKCLSRVADNFTVKFLLLVFTIKAK